MTRLVVVFDVVGPTRWSVLGVGCCRCGARLVLACYGSSLVLFWSAFSASNVQRPANTVCEDSMFEAPTLIRLVEFPTAVTHCVAPSLSSVHSRTYCSLSGMTIFLRAHCGGYANSQMRPVSLRPTLGWRLCMLLYEHVLLSPLVDYAQTQLYPYYTLHPALYLSSVHSFGICSISSFVV